MSSLEKKEYDEHKNYYQASLVYSPNNDNFKLSRHARSWFAREKTPNLI